MPDGLVIPGGPGFAGSPQPPDVPCDPTGEAWRGPPGPAGPPGPPGGLQEAPVDGTAYGRLSAAWVHVVPTSQLGYAIGQVPGPIVSQGGISALKPPAELIFQRNAFAATDGGDFRFRRATTFTGGTPSNINKTLQVEFGNTAGNGCQEWPFLVKAMNSSTAGGQLVSAYIQAWRNAGTGLTTGLITDVADFQGTPSSTSGQLTGMEWDLNATGADDGANGSRFGGIGIRQMVHAVFANMSSTINSEYTAGIWFGTGINGTASAYVDSLLCVQGGAGQPTLIRNFLDSRGAAPPPGVTDPVAAVRMSAGQIIDMNGGPALNSAPGNYLQYTTTGTPRLRYMAGATEWLSISDAGTTTVGGAITGTGPTFTWSGSTVDPNNQLLNIYANIHGTTTAGGEIGLSAFGYAADNLAAPVTTSVFGLQVNHNGRGGLTGGRAALGIRYTQFATSGNKAAGAANATFMGQFVAATANATEGGTSNAYVGAYGEVFAENVVTTLANGATNYRGAHCVEFNMNAVAGSSLYRKTMVQIIGGNGEAVKGGCGNDIMLLLGQQESASGGSPTAYYDSGLQFGDELSSWPFGPAATLIGVREPQNPLAVGSRQAVAGYGANFGVVEFASAAFRSLGYLVDGSGNLTGQSLRLANWTLSPTASGLSIDSSAQRTTALAIQAGGSGWAVGDKFTFGARGVGKVTAISAAAATAVVMLVPDVQTTPPANPVATVATNVSDGHAGGSGLTLNLTWTAATAALSLQPSGGALGFYGATPVVKQTGVAITAAGIHAALTALGLIAP